MKLSDFTHLVQALILQLILFFIFNDLWIGVFSSSAFFAGREIAQAEYRWIQQYGNGKRSNLPWWGFLDYRVWPISSWFFDLLLPIIGVVGVAVLTNYL